MEDMLRIATRFLNTRRRWIEGCELVQSCGGADVFDVSADKRVSLDLAALDGEMRALAWVLGVDPDLMNAPKPPEIVDGGGEEPVDRVRLTGIPAMGFWLLEVPANPDPAFKTEYWAAFLTDEQLMQLGQACILARSEAMVPGAHPSPGQPRRESIVRLMAPAPVSSPADCREGELPPLA